MSNMIQETRPIPGLDYVGGGGVPMSHIDYKKW